MQLKSLAKGRFQGIWQQDDALVEKTLRAYLNETCLIAEESISSGRVKQLNS